MSIGVANQVESAFCHSLKVLFIMVTICIFIQHLVSSTWSTKKKNKQKKKLRGSTVMPVNRNVWLTEC